MNDVFGWIGKIFDVILSFIPHIVIVRATHKAVKWKWGKYPHEILPGITVFWPLVSELDIRVTARQTCDIPTQVLTTSDSKSIIISIVIVYEIEDIVLAIGEKNWDVDTTIKDISQVATVEVVSCSNLNMLMMSVGAGKNSLLIKQLTDNIKSQLEDFGVNVTRVGITNFAVCRVYKLFGDEKFENSGITS